MRPFVNGRRISSLRSRAATAHDGHTVVGYATELPSTSLPAEAPLQLYARERTYPNAVEAACNRALDASPPDAIDGLAAGDDVTARCAVVDTSLTLQASLLVRHGDPAVADAFVASRISGRHHGTFGILSPDIDIAALVDRTPAASG